MMRRAPSFVTVESARPGATMTALPTDILGEIIHYVNDIGTVNALARSCVAGARIVRGLADFIADRLAKCQLPDGHLALSNGVKHGEMEIPLGFDEETFVVTYRRGVIMSWMLRTEYGDITRGHRDTHYTLSTSSSGERSDHYVCVYTEGGVYRQCPVNKPYHGQRQRLEGYIIDDVVVPSVIEQWGAAAMNLTRPTRPYMICCTTKGYARALGALGIVDARGPE